MAMAAVGTVLMIVGGVLILGGLGYVGFAWMQQDENNDGFFTDPEKGQENKDKAMLGFYIAGGGLLLTIAGVVLTIGGRRSTGGTA